MPLAWPPLTCVRVAALAAGGVAETEAKVVTGVGLEAGVEEGIEAGVEGVEAGVGVWVESVTPPPPPFSPAPLSVSSL